MKQKVLFVILAITVALFISATNGFSSGSYGSNVNSACAPEVIYSGDCALCHTGSYSSQTPAKDAYLVGGVDLTDYFCPDPAVSYTLPKNINLDAMGMGDFDGDGNPDLLLRNSLDGRWIMSLMQEDAVIIRTKIDINRNLDFELAGIADFNGDGRDDILIRDVFSGRWRMYLMDGTTVLLDSAAQIGRNLDLYIVDTADFDGDGNADVMLRDSSTGRWIMVYMDGATILLKSLL